MNGYDGEGPQFMEGFLSWAGSLPMPVYFVLGLIGAVAGFVYGLQQPEHHPQYLFAIFGGVAGFLLIPVLALVVRFIIQAVILGLVGLAVYYAFFKP